jgi:tRNA pseudouridine38-40 synthase
MTAWRLDLQYDGTEFHGWARQPGLRTVQAEVEAALSTVLREAVRLRVAGRTDAGVHAWGQVASFDTTSAVAAAIEPRRLLLSLNALLPQDVAVTAVSPAPAGFNARAARARTYRYRVWHGVPCPVRERRYAWQIRGALDADALDEAAALFVGRRDWAACTASAHLYHHCVREVRSAGWRAGEGGCCDDADEVPQTLGEVGSGLLSFEITASGFLHTMVRIAVGTMVDVAQGRMTCADIEAALASGERRRMGQTAPARGLALIRVEY